VPPSSSTRAAPVSPCTRAVDVGDASGVVAAVGYDPHPGAGAAPGHGAASHLRIDPRRASVPAAREWVTAQALHAGMPAHLVQVVELLTSEVVANAVVHAAGSDLTVHVVVDESRLTAGVTDASDDLPVSRTTGPETPGGQGVRLVELLAGTWGTDTHPSGGKTIWFTVYRVQPPHHAQ
jgi:hypothetical protein